MTTKPPENRSDDASDFEPEIPDTLDPVVPPQSSVHNRSMLNAVLSVKAPALASYSSKAREELAKASMDNDLGTHRPAKVRAAFNNSKSMLFMMPTSSSDDQGIELRYSHASCTINLFDLFGSIDRFILADRREYYPLYRTPRPITIGDRKGYAVYIKLREVTSEPVQKLSEEEKARRKAARANKKTAAGEQTGQE